MTAVFRGGLVQVLFLHHVNWSVIGWITDVRWTQPARAGPHHRHNNGANGPFAKQSP